MKKTLQGFRGTKKSFLKEMSLIKDRTTAKERLEPTQIDFILKAHNRIGAEFTEWVRARNEREAINFFLDLLVSKYGHSIKKYTITSVTIR